MMKGLRKQQVKAKEKKSWIKRIFFILIALILIMIGFFIYGYQRGISREGGAIKAEQFNGAANADGSVNILLLGADQRWDKAQEWPIQTV